MIKVCADFNARTKDDDACFILIYKKIALEKQIENLALVKGDKIILYEDEGDFEVIARLDFRHVEGLGRKAWVAIPDWSTLVRF